MPFIHVIIKKVTNCICWISSGWISASQWCHVKTAIPICTFIGKNPSFKPTSRSFFHLREGTRIRTRFTHFMKGLITPHIWFKYFYGKVKNGFWHKFDQSRKVKSVLPELWCKAMMKWRIKEKLVSLPLFLAISVCSKIS